MAFEFESTGDFKKTESWLKRMSDTDIYNSLARYGAQGVAALAKATPRDSGATASSWYYEVKKTPKGTWSIIWGNTEMAGPTPVAVLIQIGHGTGTGGYVAGRDYINPALRPIFDQMADQAWREVTRG